MLYLPQLQSLMYFSLKINKPAKLPEKAETLDAADEPVLAESA